MKHQATCSMTAGILAATFLLTGCSGGSSPEPKSSSAPSSPQVVAERGESISISPGQVIVSATSSSGQWRAATYNDGLMLDLTVLIGPEDQRFLYPQSRVIGFSPSSEYFVVSGIPEDISFASKFGGIGIVDLAAARTEHSVAELFYATNSRLPQVPYEELFAKKLIHSTPSLADITWISEDTFQFQDVLNDYRLLRVNVKTKDVRFGD